jgi:hypothetical protein
MDTKKLETSLETVEIKQTRDKVEPIRFRDETINKIKKENYNFGALSWSWSADIYNEKKNSTKIKEKELKPKSLLKRLLGKN